MREWGPRTLELVGREDAIAAAAAGIERGGGVLIVGAPGVGKTALLRALLEEEATHQGTRVLRLVAGAYGPSIPFGAFAPHVPDIERQPGARPDPFYLLQSIRRSVVASAQGGRLVIGVDDAHRLDDASATLLFQLVSTGDAVVVLTARTGDPLPDPIRSLWKEGLAERVDLSPLGDEDIVVLSEAMIGGPVDGDLAEALARASGGNPLYARELVIAGLEDGRIVERHGVWCLVGSLPIGPRLTELLDERLRGLPPNLMGALEVVAFGDPVPVEVLPSVVPGEDADALQRFGLLSVDEATDGERFARPGHPLYGELIRARITNARATELSLALAEAFEAAGRLQTDLLRVVAWRLDSGRPPATETLLLASLRAAERLDWNLSARLARAALDTGSEEAAFPLAEALGQLERFPEALSVLEGREPASDEERARVAILRSSVLFWGSGQFEDAEAALAAAEAGIASPEERAWVGAVRAGMLTALGRPGECVSTARRILDVPGLSERTADAATSALAMGLVWSGRADEGVSLAQASVDQGLERYGSVPLATRWPAAVRLAAYRMAGRVDDMDEFASDEYQMAIQLHNRQGRAAAAAGLGWVALMRGHLALAAMRLREAVGSLEGPDASAGRGQALVVLSEAVALAGDPLGATGVLAEARQEMFAAPDWAAPRLHWCAAWAAASRGELSLAASEMQQAADHAERTGQTSFELIALGAMARLGSPQRLERLAELAAVMEGPLAGLVFDHARARVSASGDDLDEVSERFEEAGLVLYAAEVAAQSSRVHSGAGEPRKAAAATLRAQALLARCDSARPLTVMVASSPASLTRREREVALLARSGLSSQAIAARLHLSVRTVDTHLARVYYKLGISKRGDLGSALDGEPEAASGSD